MASKITDEQRSDIDDAWEQCAKGKARLDAATLGAVLRWLGQNPMPADLVQMAGGLF